MKLKIRLLFLISILIILCSALVNSQYYQDYTDSSTSDSYYSSDYANETKIPDWYEVSDEEVEFCRNYGGVKDSNSVYQTAEGGLPQPVSQLTLSVQGTYTTEYDKRLYEFAWYVQPLSEDTTYSIDLVKDNGETEEFTRGNAPATTGDAQYDTRETDAIYTDIEIVLEDGSIGLKVPIVEKSPY
ncbi:hypothetical protein HZA99_05170 [Candidatus Woesearchaeota archaeon]|nr:hypothetical protein [Candidatus Woesearchaeota archaeon]